jgi:hypothetical protein
MPVTYIMQQTEDDCLPCCIAMVLDESREKVLSWFEGRNYGSIQDMREVLSIRGYEVKDVRQVGCAGGVRRIVALTHKADNKGHAVVMDDDESIVTLLKMYSSSEKGADLHSRAARLFQRKVGLLPFPFE